MKKTRFNLLEMMLSEHAFIINEGFSEANYARAVAYVLENGVVFTPDDPKYGPILELDVSEIKEEFDDDVAGEVHKIIDLIVEYQNRYDYIPMYDEFDEYNDDCNDYYDE